MGVQFPQYRVSALQKACKECEDFEFILVNNTAGKRHTNEIHIHIQYKKVLLFEQEKNELHKSFTSITSSAGACSMRNKQEQLETLSQFQGFNVTVTP